MEVYFCSDGIPSDWKKIPRWANWYYRHGKKKPTRNVDEPDTWMPYDEAFGRYQRLRVDGLGFHLGIDGPYLFAGIDLDDCLLSVTFSDRGLPAEVIFKDWAKPIADMWTGYLEVSPSRNGVKGLGLAELPPNFDHTPIEDGALELYSKKRYFTATGWVIPGFDRPVVQDVQESLNAICHQFAREKPKVDIDCETDPPAAELEEILQAFLSAKKNRFENRRLFESTPDELFGLPSRSEADFKLFGKLAYWADRHPETVANLFLMSGRADRSKMDDNAKYVIRSSIKACRQQVGKFNWAVKNPTIGVMRCDITLGPTVPQRTVAPHYQTRGGNLFQNRSLPNLSADGFEWDMDDLLVPKIYRPLVELESIFGSGCQRMKIRLRKIGEPLHLKLVVRPCLTLGCDRCGPRKREINCLWYGSIAMQWPDVWMARFKRDARTQFPGLWFSIPQDGDGIEPHRTVYLNEAVPGAERIPRAAAAVELIRSFGLWPDRSRINAQELIRLPEIEDIETTGKWEKHPRQCGFRHITDFKNIKECIVTHHQDVREITFDSARSLEYRVVSDMDDARVCKIMDDGYVNDGTRFFFDGI